MGVADDAKGIEQPDDDADQHHHVQDAFDGGVHRNVGVDQPEQDADDDEGDDQRNHIYSFLGCAGSTGVVVVILLP